MLKPGGRPPNAAEFLAYQLRQRVAAEARGARPFPGLVSLLAFQCAAACREIGEASRTRLRGS